ERYPEIYQREDFKVVVSGSPERLKSLKESGAFDEHLREGKVDFKDQDRDSPPDVDEDTLLAFAPSPSRFPTVNLYKEAGTGQVRGINNRSYLPNDRVVVGVNDSGGTPAPQ